MKASAPLIFVCLAMASCTAAPPPQQALAGASRCIPLDQVVARRIAGPMGVDFEMLGGTTYRNHLASKCPAFERLGDNAVVAVTAGAETGSLCAGDQVKIFDPVEIQATGLKGYPSCRLGQFTAMPTP